MLSTTQPRYYFAYGCNLNLAEIKKKCPNIKVLGPMKLPNYKLEFFGYSSVWDGAVESVIPDLASEVWGVLYKLDSASWEELDNYEDARFDGTGAYFHYPVEVIDNNGMLVPATIYKKSELRQPQLPSTEYLDIILKGAKEHSLPAAYVAGLALRETKKAHYPVPKQRKNCNFGDCSGCSTS